MVKYGRYIVIKPTGDKSEMYLNGFTDSGPRWIKNKKVAKSYNTRTEAEIIALGLKETFEKYRYVDAK